MLSTGSETDKKKAGLYAIGWPVAQSELLCLLKGEILGFCVAVTGCTGMFVLFYIVIFNQAPLMIMCCD